MRMRTFVDKYCSDIVAKHDKLNELFDTDDLPYEKIIEDADGNPLKVIVVGGEDIAVLDIVTSYRGDFLKRHPQEGMGEAYDNYCNAVNLLCGEEALSQFRKAMSVELTQINDTAEEFRCTY